MAYSLKVLRVFDMLQCTVLAIEGKRGHVGFGHKIRAP